MTSTASVIDSFEGEDFNRLEEFTSAQHVLERRLGCLYFQCRMEASCLLARVCPATHASLGSTHVLFLVTSSLAALHCFKFL